MAKRTVFIGISVIATTALAVACNQVLDDGVLRWAWAPVALLLGLIVLVSDDLRRRFGGEGEHVEEPSIETDGAVDVAVIGNGNAVGGTGTDPRGGEEVPDGTGSAGPPRGRISARGNVGTAVVGNGNAVAGGHDRATGPDDR